MSCCWQRSQCNLVRLPNSVSFEQGAHFGYFGTSFAALRRAGAWPGRTVLIDGISGTLGLGAYLNALAMGCTRILGTGRNAALLDDVKAIAPDRIHVLPAGDTRCATRPASTTRGRASTSSLPAGHGKRHQLSLHPTRRPSN